MTNFWRFSVWLGLFALATAFAHAEFQPLVTIADAAAGKARRDALSAGYQSVDVEVRPLDQRLRLATCSQPLTAFGGAANRVLGPLSIGVRCRGDAPWTIYVRTRVSANITVPVLTRSLQRGHLLAASDIKMAEHKLDRPQANLYLDIAQLLGKELRRPLPAGSPLAAHQLRSPRLIERGQVVELVAGGPGVKVRMQGKALANAAAGDRILVDNLRSGRRVEGVVNSDGSVRIR